MEKLENKSSDVLLCAYFSSYVIEFSDLSKKSEHNKSTHGG